MSVIIISTTFLKNSPTCLHELKQITLLNLTFQYCPVWVAPNLLTFTGFLLTVLNFLLFSYYDFGFYALTEENITKDSIPAWVWAVTAVTLFVAYTLGKHNMLEYNHYHYIL